MLSAQDAKMRLETAFNFLPATHGMMAPFHIAGSNLVNPDHFSIQQVRHGWLTCACLEHSHRGHELQGFRGHPANMVQDAELHEMWSLWSGNDHSASSGRWQASRLLQNRFNRWD